MSAAPSGWRPPTAYERNAMLCYAHSDEFDAGCWRIACAYADGRAQRSPWLYALRKATDQEWTQAVQANTKPASKPIDLRRARWTKLGDELGIGAPTSDELEKLISIGEREPDADEVVTQCANGAKNWPTVIARYWEFDRQQSAEASMSLAEGLGLIREAIG